MASTATTRNRLEKQGTGENTGTWGTKLNTATIDLIDAALDGRTAFTLSGSKTLTSVNYAADESRMRFIDITGGTGGTVTIPSLEKWYLVRNSASGAVTFTTGGGTTTEVASGDTGLIVCDATNVRTVGVTKAYVAQAILDAGLSGIPGLAASVVTFLTNPTSANLAAAVTDETGTGALVFGTSPIITTPTISGATITTPTISGATISGSTLTSPTISNATVNTVTLNGATIPGPTISSATINTATINAATLTGASYFNGPARGNVTAVSASQIDCSAGNYFTKTATGALTWTVANVPSSGSFSFILELTNGGTGAQTWFSGIKWPNGNPPVLAASGVDVLGFITDDGGTTWRGVQLMKDSK